MSALSELRYALGYRPKRVYLDYETSNWWREFALAGAGIRPPACDCQHEEHSTAPGIGCTTAGCLCLHDGTPRRSGIMVG